MIATRYRALVSGLLLCMAGLVHADGLKYVETADGAKRSSTRHLVQWTHTRLVFDKPLERVAVGQESTLKLEVLGEYEILALAKNVGRTSIMVWYADQTTETFLFSVVQDLSVLRRALSDVHPRIRIELAPDRAALVLRGRVPTVKYRLGAQGVAENYLFAGQRNRDAGPADSVLQAPGGVRVDRGPRASGFGASIINLIQVDELPQSHEDKILAAIRDVGGHDVKVRRIQTGDLVDNGVDTLVLAGEVANQVVLTRVLNIASRLFLGVAADQPGGVQITPLTDESGAMLNGRQSAANAATGFGVSADDLDNDIRANIGRSKLISAAGGRILSMIEVRDLPQVRVSVQMHEVDRLRLKSWRPDISAMSSGYRRDGGFTQSGLQPVEGASTVENALRMVGGALSNNLQIANGRFAFDMLFSLLEEEGISRTLSRPTLTVLAGESAVFRAGGEVPIPSAFAPSGLSADDSVGQNTSGVFSGTEFKAFGVELKVRAMVDENDQITLDINPTVSLPDTALTRQIADSTGASLNAAAFDVRSISTSTRARDGQPLVLGGLVSRDISDRSAHTPGISDVPLVGRLAESTSQSDNERELIIVVTPTIVREPKHDLNLWHFPNPRLLLREGLSPQHRHLRSTASAPEIS